MPNKPDDTSSQRCHGSAQVLEVDVAFLGGGVAGYTGAIRARQRGASAAVVEREDLGGTCTNRGCIPAKALIHCAEVVRQVRRAKEFGITVGAPEVEWAGVVRHVQGTVKRLRKGVEFLMERNGVQVVRGRGRLDDAHTIEVEGEEGAAVVRARKIVICTGSEPAIIPIPGAVEHTITTDDIYSIEALPRRFAVIGGGFIGCETAYAMADLGSQVSIIEMTDHILPNVEPDLADELARGLKRIGIKIKAPAQVTAVEARNGAKVVKYSDASGEGEVEADLVLLAVGRRAVAQGSGAKEIGVEIERGRIVVNERMETAVPGVYAAGDVIGEPMLAHAASAEAKVAVTNALGGDARLDLRAMPFCVYTWPELASVGLNETQARAAGLELRVGTFPFRAVGKAVAIGERDGFVKVLVSGDQLAGAHIVGPEATDLIAEAAAGIWARTPVETFAEGIRAHPTLAEGIVEAVEDALGRPLHK
jgi:dihydrolipoamide dehydrogenase